MFELDDPAKERVESELEDAVARLREVEKGRIERQEDDEGQSWLVVPDSRQSIREELKNLERLISKIVGSRISSALVELLGQEEEFRSGDGDVHMRFELRDGKVVSERKVVVDGVQRERETVWGGSLYLRRYGHVINLLDKGDPVRIKLEE